MKTVWMAGKDPHENLALMEHLLKNKTEDFALVFENENALIVGRNQNTYEVINSAFVREHDVSVLRRITGGGAVFQDAGNINFAFLVSTKRHGNDFEKFTRPALRVLKSLGVEAGFAGRNDLVTGGGKIGGNAQHRYKGRLFDGGTVLFDADLGKLVRALNVDPEKYRSKGIKSVHSRIANVKPHLDSPITRQAFKERLLKEMLGTEDIAAKVRKLTEDDEKNIAKLAKERYHSWEWNFGRSPRFTVKKEQRFPAGKVSFYLDIHSGRIEAVRIFGDFMGAEDLGPLEQRLQGALFKEDVLRKRLEKEPLEEYFRGITLENVLDCLFG